MFNQNHNVMKPLKFAPDFLLAGGHHVIKRGQEHRHLTEALPRYNDPEAQRVVTALGYPVQFIGLRFCDIDALHTFYIN